VYKSAVRCWLPSSILPKGESEHTKFRIRTLFDTVFEQIFFVDPHTSRISYQQQVHRYGNPAKMDSGPSRTICSRCGIAYVPNPGVVQSMTICLFCSRYTQSQYDTMDPSDTTRLNPAFYLSNWENPSASSPREPHVTHSHRLPSLPPSDFRSPSPGFGHESQIPPSQRLSSLPPSD
jgi:hypothetical protein